MNPQRLHLIVNPVEFQTLWQALGDKPAKDVFPLMEKLKAQVVPQEQAMMARATGQTQAPAPAAPAEVQPPSPPPDASTPASNEAAP